MTTGTRITKAIVPAAGLDTRLMPASLAMPKAMFPIVGPDGRVRPVGHMLIREAVAAGIEQIAVIVSPGGEHAFERYFREHRGTPRGEAVPSARADLEELAELAGRITYVTQPRPEGFGDAVRCARQFAGGEPVLVMLSDHLYLADPGAPSPTAQVLGCFADLQAASVIGVGVTPVDQLHSHGVVVADPTSDGLLVVREIVEKPAIQTARDRLTTPGLPTDHYLTHFGLYCFASVIFDALDGLATDASRGSEELQLTEAQQRLVEQGGATYAVAIRGRSLDMGNPADLVRCQVEIAAGGGTSRKP